MKERISGRKASNASKIQTAYPNLKRAVLLMARDQGLGDYSLTQENFDATVQAVHGVFGFGTTARVEVLLGKLDDASMEQACVSENCFQFLEDIFGHKAQEVNAVLEEAFTSIGNWDQV